MMTQEEFMDVMAMKRQGLSIKEIAEETGYHPSTISGWLKNGGPPARRTSPNPPVIDELWSARIAELVRAAPRLLATSVFELIAAEGYGGSYVSVARHLFELRGPRFTAAPAASTRIVTAPGEECQFDWSDVSHWTREWGLGDIQCFQGILSWSRVKSLRQCTGSQRRWEDPQGGRSKGHARFYGAIPPYDLEIGGNHEGGFHQHQPLNVLGNESTCGCERAERLVKFTEHLAQAHDTSSSSSSVTRGASLPNAQQHWERPSMPSSLLALPTRATSFHASVRCGS